MDFTELTVIVVSALAALHTVLCKPYDGHRRKIDPRFLPTKTNITAHRGATVILDCRIHELGHKVVVWRKKGTDVPITIAKELFAQKDHMSIDVAKIAEKDWKYSLIIKDVQLRHAGTYLCQVTASKLYTHYITLDVVDIPSITEPAETSHTGNTTTASTNTTDSATTDTVGSSSSGNTVATGMKTSTMEDQASVNDCRSNNRHDITLSGREYINQGEQIKITCNATGVTHAPDTVDWFFKGERIVTSSQRWRDRTQIIKRRKDRSYVSDLVIDRSQMVDQGNFVCRSSDLKVKSFNVHVLSAGKTNVSRRGSESGNLSEYPSSSATSNASRKYNIISIFMSIVTSMYVTCCLTNTDVITMMTGFAPLLLNFHSHSRR